MSTLMQSIADLINREIRKFVEKVHEEFPQIPINNILVVWCEQQGIPFSTFCGLQELEENLSTYLC
jgi:hypothetical protein